MFVAVLLAVCIVSVIVCILRPQTVDDVKAAVKAVVVKIKEKLSRDN